MTQLIKLRQRIKLIGSIQKVTEAMRLVSMSVHSRLNSQIIYLKNYQTELNQLLAATHNLGQTSSFDHHQRLIILVGSQKGLCGTFNKEVLDKFLKEASSTESTKLIVIGKKLIDLIQPRYQIQYSFPKFTPTSLKKMVEEIFKYITAPDQANMTVTCFSNQSRTFFTHNTKISPIRPLSKINPSKENYATDPYTWEQPAVKLSQLLIENQIRFNLYCILLDSLIAEYAARFRAMDNAARNAGSLLEVAERQFAKARQAKITRELIELSAIFQTK